MQGTLLFSFLRQKASTSNTTVLLVRVRPSVHTRCQIESSTVEMSFRITACTGNVVERNYIPRDEATRASVGRGPRASLTRCLMTSQCAAVSAQISSAFDVSRNDVTGERRFFHICLSLSLPLFFSLLLDGDSETVSKMQEHFQKWPLSKASFNARNCRAPSISAIRCRDQEYCDSEALSKSYPYVCRVLTGSPRRRSVNRETLSYRPFEN